MNGEASARNRHAAAMPGEFDAVAAQDRYKTPLIVVDFAQDFSLINSSLTESTMLSTRLVFPLTSSRGLCISA